jgi:hypothetical protein
MLTDDRSTAWDGAVIHQSSAARSRPGRGERRIAEVAEALGISAQSIYTWRRQDASTRACYGERSHSIDAEEFYQLLDGVVIDDTQVFNDKLCEWENFYNYHRPTEHWAARRPMKDSSSEPRPR